MRVRGPRRPRAHEAGHFENELVAHALGLRKHVGRIRVEDQLQQALAIAQVDEDHAAVIAPAMRPAGHRDDLADQSLSDLAAIMSSHISAARRAS